MERARKGFTALEMLMVATILGLLMAITIPNLLNMLQRAKQKRSMSDMRALAIALETYGVDNKHYPTSGAFTIEVIYGDLAYPTDTVADIMTYLSPTYLKVIPLVDGWSSWFLFTSSDTDYGIVSCGKDGAALEPPNPGPTTNFNTDIVISDGHFTVYPDGAPQQ